ncbi:MAG TPA: hypothetical protein VFQ06_13545, partial [Nitrospira sp.]|nr:hypothetical protein [Nitrospira sp.]
MISWYPSGGGTAHGILWNTLEPVKRTSAVRRRSGRIKVKSRGSHAGVIGLEEKAEPVWSLKMKRRE